MMLWQRTNNRDGYRYIFSADRRFSLRQVKSSKGTWCVWALYFVGQRIYEVHALSDVGIVMVDAMEHIRDAARVAA